MARFIYKMQNILEIKFKLEDQAKLAYANEKLKLDNEQKRLEYLYSRKSGYEVQLRNSIMSNLNLLNIKKYEESVEIIKYSIKLQDINVKRAEQNVEMARIKLNEVMIERKTYEKLKEKEVEEFKQEVNSDERKEVDELVSFRYNNSYNSEENR